MCPSFTFMKRSYAVYSYIILCTCLFENNAFSVMHYVEKVTLHYLMLSLRDSFCLESFAHGFIMLPPQSSLGCSLAIILRDRLQHGSWEGDCTHIRTSINFVVRNGFTCEFFWSETLLGVNSLLARVSVRGYLSVSTR